MNFNITEYKNKVLGCWMGKNIGGTLGAPMEWKRQINNVSFYPDSVVNAASPLPNDDLDLQLIWLLAMEERGVDIDAQVLAEYWLALISPHWLEYGVCKVNMRQGLMPPLSGMVDNPTKDSNGAWIRTEIWACIAPGCPEIAARYAYEDAIVDHGDGEGMYAAIFCAALESAAFVEKDTYKLIDIGLSYIPEDCGIAKAVLCAIDCYKSGKTWLETRDAILDKHRGNATTWSGISEEDIKKGFAEGKIGYDAPSNIALIISGWLFGEGDFEKSLLIIINSGEDTDCTAGTFGSIYGIIHGIDGIPEKWKAPIGRSIKTVSINLGDIGYLGDMISKDIDNLTERTFKITQRVLDRFAPHVTISNELSELSNIKNLMSNDRGAYIYRCLQGPVFKFPFIDVLVQYPEGVFVRNGQNIKIKYFLAAKNRIPQSFCMKVITPEGWNVSPAKKGKVPLWKWLELEFKIDEVQDNISRFVLEITSDSTSAVVLVPIVLLNGNLH